MCDDLSVLKSAQKKNKTVLTSILYSFEALHLFHSQGSGA